MSDDYTIGPVVHVVDDDEGVRDSLAMLFKSVRLEAFTYPDAASFLDGFDPTRPSCVVCDIRMPGMSGTQLQARLKECGTQVPIIFITGHGDVPLAVTAMREGAVDFLEKPFNDELLLQRVQEALEADARRFERERDRTRIRERYADLTEREREIMAHLLQGRANKVIAIELGISPRTVELHRSRVLAKMGVRTPTELVGLAETGGLTSA